MLENLYTTKMSSNKKVLQKRFTKIRSKSGKLAKMMSLVMTLALALALVTATVVMAAVDADDLEHWDKKEAYYTGGMTFDINISNRKTPDYIKKDIAGADGNIHCNLKQYDLRFESGMINTTGTLTVSGNSGQLIMPLMNNYVPDTDNDFCKSIIKQTNADYLTGYTFHISDSKFSWNAWDIFDIPLSDSTHWITIYFAISNNKLTDVIFTFNGEYILTEDYRQIGVGEDMDWLKAEKLKLFGNIADTVVSFNKMMRGGRVFNAYEQNGYNNLSVDGFNMSITGITENEISIKNNISYNKESIDFALVQIYDENNIMVFYKNVLSPDLKGIMQIKAPNNKNLTRGKRYRMETSYWHDSMGKLIYRHQDYVTIP